MNQGLLRALALVLGTGASACGASAPEPRPAEPVRLVGDAHLLTLATPVVDVSVGSFKPVPAAAAKRLVLITLDGVRFQDVFDGVDPGLAAEHRMRDDEMLTGPALTPNLHRVMERGVALGASAESPMLASGPNFASLPGYDELLTGKPSECQRNDCGQVTERTLLEACREAPDTHDEDVAMVASWENLERAAAVDPSRLFLTAGRHHGFHREQLRRDPVLGPLLKRGEKAFPPPGQNDYRPDRFTAPLALRYLQTKKPRCLFVGLGDSDELAHLDDYRGYLKALTFADRFIGDVVAALETMGDAGAETTLWITTDHGRATGFVSHGAKSPESARVWLAAAGAGVTRGEALPIRRLADVAPVIASKMGLTMTLASAPLAGAAP